jgi:hypothetical protein
MCRSTVLREPCWEFSTLVQDTSKCFFLEHTQVGVSIDMFIKKEGVYDKILPNATPYRQPRCSLFLSISIPVWVMPRPVAGVLSIYLTISIKISSLNRIVDRKLAFRAYCCVAHSQNSIRRSGSSSLNFHRS